MTSYKLSQQINAQTILFYTVALPIYRGAMAIDKACQALMAMLPALLFWLGILAKALGLVAVIAGIVAAVACIPVTFWGGLLVVAAFGWLTFPRAKAVRK